MANIPLTIQGQTGFDQYVDQAAGEPLTGRSIETVQVNVGLKCNLACHHCHVESSPKRTEQMSWQTMLDVLAAARMAGAQTLDITGGAPEMHPRFCDFVDAAIKQKLAVMVRTNLTIMLVDGYKDLPQFYADRGVHLVASLPCYLPNNVDKQRGRHVYRDSIEVIQRLNRIGYGSNSDKVLDLVYNPLGPTLPPEQKKLEKAYRVALFDQFDIRFNNLYAITNIAIGRFLHDLARDGKAEAYQQLLRDAFNPQTLEGLMCRHQLHVGHDGTMFDCDFNYALGLPMTGTLRHVRDFEPTRFMQRRIATGEHCFACTAGCGSSCGGALA
ncbi:arsenosugar biosynthesis radical SAM (seleno)protein ArsS [Phycisphaerales bacterium AB-hyl4]|uniref:Arsenosugar biosynthesis radical SAM (Seleno)protein ArsS n=1 Tax=Natronomicrosphaera hydrolytica TaxID=3242702 RepID=A0ABV4U9D6_9BACT